MTPSDRRIVVGLLQGRFGTTRASCLCRGLLWRDMLACFEHTHPVRRWIVLWDTGP